MKNHELHNLRLHLLGQDPVSLLEFHPQLPMTDANWSTADNKFFDFIKCPRTVGSNPKEDIEKIITNSPCPKTSILSLKYIIEETNYASTKWDNPKNPYLGEDELEPTYNIALKILQTLAKNNLIWAACLPDVRASETWLAFKDLPEDDIRVPHKDLSSRLTKPQDLKLLLKGNPKRLPPLPDFKAEVLIFKDIGLEILKDKYFLRDIPFVCPLVGEDEVCGVVSYKGPLIIANKSYLDLLEKNPKEAQKLYRYASEDLFFYRKEDYNQELYDIDSFRIDYPDSIHLLANPILAVNSHIKEVEDTISNAIANLTKRILPNTSEEIKHTCQETEGLQLEYLNWNPEEGLSLKINYTSNKFSKIIEIKSGKTKITTS